MAHFSFTVVVMTSLSAALLAACGTGGTSATDGYSGGTDSDWYDQRQDEVGCAGEAQRSGLFPGDAFDSYVSNCVIDRESERDRQQ